MEKRVWIVAEFYYPEETATGYYLTKIAEGLALKFAVHVICCRPSNREVPHVELRKGVEIYRCFAAPLNKNILLFRMVRLISVTISIFWKLLSCITHGDVVIVVTNPPSLPFIARVACWLHRAECVLLIHDVYPDVLIASGLAKKGSLFTELLMWMNQKLFESLEHIIVIGRDMRLLVQKHIRNKRAQIECIPHWADVESINPLPRVHNELLVRLRLTEKFVIQYSGNMGRTHDIETIVGAAQQLCDRDSIHFLFIGTGAKRVWLERTVQTTHLQNITILPPQPRENLSIVLNACDVAIVALVEGMGGVSVPSRLYNILAAGKPIIALTEPDSELGRVITEDRTGWLVPQGNVDALVKTILAIDGRHQLDIISLRARAAAEEKYLFSQSMEKYYSLIGRIVAE